MCGVLFFLTAACFCALSMVFAEIRGVRISFCSLRNQPFVMSQNKLLPHWYLCTCVPPTLGLLVTAPSKHVEEMCKKQFSLTTLNRWLSVLFLDLQCFEFIHLTKLCWITGWKIKSLKIMGPFNLTRAKKNLEIMRFGVFVNEGHHAQHAVSGCLCSPCFF